MESMQDFAYALIEVLMRLKFAVYVLATTVAASVLIHALLVRKRRRRG